MERRLVLLGGAEVSMGAAVLEAAAAGTLAPPTSPSPPDRSPPAAVDGAGAWTLAPPSPSSPPEESALAAVDGAAAGEGAACVLSVVGLNTLGSTYCISSW